MSALYEALDKHFLARECLARAQLLARHGRAEADGWFKAETMFALEAMVKEGTIDGWRANVPLTEDTKQRCDFRIVMSGQPTWLEVKTLVDPARAAADMSFMARGGGFTDDLVKLLRAPDGDKVVLLFVLPRPAPEQWSDLLETYQRRIAPITFSEQSLIEAYPDALYVCKLALREMF
jgi:hypothetical protein